MATGTDLLVAALIFGGIGLFLVGAGLREAYLAFRLWRIRPVPIGGLDEAAGTVTVSGTVERLDETVRAPLTGTDCLGYAWRVLGVQTTRGFDGRIEQSYHQLGTGRKAVRFRLHDPTGSVVVDPDGAALRLQEEHVVDPVDDPVGRRAGTLPGVDFDGPRQYYEARIDEGETVVVQAGVRPSDDPRLDVERVGVQLSGRGMYVSDTGQRQAMRRSAGAAALSLVLGLAALAVLAVIVGVVPL
ncbi:hypothetical protein [Haloarchaeobius amylolyticus]|uniref:hypothetical protein n=1 Tax=Haloarchaeobius amylolyticus TaxID=1198296 RepID=UPI00226D549C|nr:hypothetical protein [Haloarchaeobius amylolyticus]